MSTKPRYVVFIGVLSLATAVVACSGSVRSTGGPAASGGDTTTASGGSASSGMSGTSTGGSTAGGAARGGDGAGGGDIGAAGSSSDQCTSFFPGVDKSCTSAADCALVDHTLNCCGSVLEMAINASAAAEFKTVEQGCDAQLPACGCASFGTSAEDGTLVSNPSTIVAACTNHTCESHYRGSTFDCSGSVCTDQQYCIIWSGGPAGSQPKGTCSSFVENCNDCGCTGAGVCACAIQDGHVIVHCQAT